MSLQNFPVDKSALFEIPVVNANVETIKFNDTEKMFDSMFIKGIIISSENAGKSPEGRTLVSDALKKKMFLTLTNKKTGVQEIKRFPIEAIMNGQQWVLEFNKFPVDISKSFITIYDRAGLTVNTAILMTFLYE